MNPSIDPLSEKLGEIRAQLEMVLKTQAEDRSASASYRTDVRKELATITSSVNDVKNRVNNTADEVATVRHEVDKRIEAVDKRVSALAVETTDYRDWKLRAEGAGKLTKIFWAVFSAIGLGGAIAILEMFRNWRK